jgi:hypothetical protein
MIRRDRKGTLNAVSIITSQIMDSVLAFAAFVPATGLFRICRGMLYKPSSFWTAVLDRTTLLEHAAIHGYPTIGSLLAGKFVSTTVALVLFAACSVVCSGSSSPSCPTPAFVLWNAITEQRQ